MFTKIPPIVPTIARYILGLIFFVFGLNGFLNFIPAPPPPENVAAVMNSWMSMGYFFPVIKGTEVVCGFLLLTGFFVPLALIILAPIALQIFLFHAFMTPGIQYLIMPIAIIVLGLLAAHRYRDLYLPLLKPKA